jgi:predicted Rossmann fold flavoprotein
MDTWDVVVIGGGPAGLSCAIHAAGPGCRVALFEKNPRPGAKLLLAGSGQCNLTHAGDVRDFTARYGAHGKYLKPALMAFPNTALARFFAERGLALETEENGKIFPAGRSSADVLAVLLRACDERGVVLRCDEPVLSLGRDGDGFVIATGRDSCRARTVVITTGGASYPKTGSTGDGYRLAAALGQTVTETGPALSPLLVRDYAFAQLAGISIGQAPFTLWRDGKKAGSYRGDILFTHKGLSGPGILDASRDIRAGDTVRVSFADGIPREAFAVEVSRLVQAGGPRLVRTVLAGLEIPDRLLRAILQASKVPDDLTCAHLTAAQRREIIANCTEFPFVVERVGDFSIAMATRGGIALEQVNTKTMESKLVPGLFFAGEVLDIDGDTGGYNIQAAFSTGFLAAEGIRKRIGTTSVQ